MARGAAGRCDQHLAPDEVGSGRGHALGDDAAERVADKVNRSLGHRLDELDGILGEITDGVAMAALAVAVAALIEQQETKMLGERRE
jgi:hypothetical protein